MALIIDRKDGQSVTLEWPNHERVDVAIEGDELAVYPIYFGTRGRPTHHAIGGAVSIGAEVSVECRPSKRAGYVAVRIDAPKSVRIYETERPRAAS